MRQPRRRESLLRRRSSWLHCRRAKRSREIPARSKGSIPTAEAASRAFRRPAAEVHVCICWASLGGARASSARVSAAIMPMDSRPNSSSEASGASFTIRRARETRRVPPSPRPPSAYAWGSIRGTRRTRGTIIANEMIVANPIGAGAVHQSRKSTVVSTAIDTGRSKSSPERPIGGIPSTGIHQPALDAANAYGCTTMKIKRSSRNWLPDAAAYSRSSLRSPTDGGADRFQMFTALTDLSKIGPQRAARLARTGRCGLRAAQLRSGRRLRRQRDPAARPGPGGSRASIDLLADSCHGLVDLAQGGSDSLAMLSGESAPSGSWRVRSHTSSSLDRDSRADSISQNQRAEFLAPSSSRERLAPIA